MQEIKVRLFQESDALAVSNMIIDTLRSINIKDYTNEEIEEVVARNQVDHIKDRASWTHFYVALIDGKIVASAAIGPYWDKEDESSLFSVFVDKNHLGMGIGRLLMQTLEQDDYYKRAKRIEIPSSISPTRSSWKILCPSFHAR